MTDCILLRLDAPLMSFGGPVIDQEGGTRDAPGQSMIAGLLANALGWEHRDHERLQALQAALVYAVRRDQLPVSLHDYQTVDLGQPHLKSGWTSWNRVESRGGGSSSGTHIRKRVFLAGGVYTVAFTLRAAPPSLDEVEAALREPARPLFLGRKPCIPSVPLLLGRIAAKTPLEALRMTPPFSRRASEPKDQESFYAWWPEEMEDSGVIQSRLLSVSDERDWTNRIHSGRRFIREGRVRYKKGAKA